MRRRARTSSPPRSDAAQHPPGAAAGAGQEPVPAGGRPRPNGGAAPSSKARRDYAAMTMDARMGPRCRPPRRRGGPSMGASHVDDDRVPAQPVKIDVSAEVGVIRCPTMGWRPTALIGRFASHAVAADPEFAARYDPGRRLSLPPRSRLISRRDARAFCARSMAQQVQRRRRRSLHSRPAPASALMSASLITRSTAISDLMWCRGRPACCPRRSCPDRRNAA